LVELFEHTDPEALLRRRRRPEQVHLTHRLHGRAVLRDQKPLSENKLAAALTDGWTVPDWLAFLNDQVFLFPDPTPRDKIIDAYAGQPMLVLTLRTQSLLDEYGVWVKVSSINGGATLYDARPRGVSVVA
jgi:hypothetical protein